MALQIPVTAAGISKVEKYSDHEIKILKERTFVKEALYGYMNGGSDLYYEYGFRELKVFDIEFQKANYTVEIYFMSSPEEAFGIYSQHTYKCTSADSVLFTDCTSRRQYQLADGDTYLSVVFDPFKNGNSQGAVSLSQFFLSKYRTDKRPVIPDSVLDVLRDRKISKFLKYATGPISLGNLDYHSSELLEGLNPYKVWLVKESDKDIFFCSLKSLENYETLKKRIEQERSYEDESGKAFLMSESKEEKSGGYCLMFYIKR